MREYLAALAGVAGRVEATDARGNPVALEHAVGSTIERVKQAHDSGHKLIFIGNGGSAAIASHMAIDYSKNGNLRALALNDPAALTCLSNDLGFENVFAKQIELHGWSGDVVVAISSSGRSANILNAVRAAKDKRIDVLTLSGFTPDNPLRMEGGTNFYVPSGEYGFVEITHLILCHAILDLAMGWKPANQAAATGPGPAVE
jgi:D-sedoheptulose 7-phosphate isomerase